jgi:hypothetical protein
LYSTTILLFTGYFTNVQEVGSPHHRLHLQLQLYPIIYIAAKAIAAATPPTTHGACVIIGIPPLAVLLTAPAEVLPDVELAVFVAAVAALPAGPAVIVTAVIPRLAVPEKLVVVTLENEEADALPEMCPFIVTEQTPDMEFVTTQPKSIVLKSSVFTAKEWNAICLLSTVCINHCVGVVHS